MIKINLDKQEIEDMTYSKKELAKFMDHTLLKANATPEQIKNLCDEAVKYGFFSVCVNPCYVELAKSELEGSDVKVCTVIGFPLGANTTEVKAFEASEAVLNGADEVDMVINIGKLKAKDYDYVRDEISAVRGSSKEATLKVIIETALLDQDEIKIASQLAVSGGADFVKTSTGFSTSGAKAEDVKLMRETVGEKFGVKASGGIRTLDDALSMIKNGASRLGVSSSVSIIDSVEE